MEKTLLESYLDAVEGLILDENKAVTFKSLSKYLRIHVNTAKQILHIFLSRHKDKNSFPICATYLLVGRFHDGSLTTMIVNESDKKSEMSKLVEVTTDHVYSIQSGKLVKNIKTFGGFNGEDKTSKHIIKCSKSNKKNSHKISQDLKVLKQIPHENEVSSQAEPVNCNIDTPTAEKCNNALKSSNDNFFKSSKKSKSLENKSKQEKKENVLSKQTQFMGNFFFNVSNKTLANAEESNNESKPSNFNNCENTLDNFEVKNLTTKKFNNVDEIEKSGDSYKSSKPKKNIKRKRIQVVESDDSDSSNSAEPLSEEDIEDEKVVEIQEIKSDEESASQNKRKKRKIVDITVMSDDGYLETRKQVTLATDSEDENEQSQGSVKNKAEQTKEENKTKETSMNKVPKKQSSLFAFFKKQ